MPARASDRRFPRNPKLRPKDLRPGEHVLPGSLLAYHIALLGSVVGARNHFAPYVWEGAEMEELVTVCMFADVGKYDRFVFNDSAWHQERGIFWEYDKDPLRLQLLGQDEVLAMMSGVSIDLTENEYLGLRTVHNLEQGNNNYTFSAPMWLRMIVGLNAVIKHNDFPLIATANETLEKLGLETIDLEVPW
tara:strand:- start:3782 stop:4351 length:570 start_codon:yes stop_codon:yes gene_type:complete